MPEFRLNSQTFQAKRMPQPFKTKIDGMKLIGYGMDWCITREDGQSFPMPDHIFKMLFEPVDDEAKVLYAAKYNLRVGFSEGVKLRDIIQSALGSLKPSRENVPYPENEAK